MYKMRCKITLHHARPYDKDNAYGACKPVVDALVRNGALWEDTPYYTDLTVEQEKFPHKKRFTSIELEPA
jgi:hypothetical protein